MTPGTRVLATFSRKSTDAPKAVHKLVGEYLGEETKDGQRVIVIRERGERGWVWREKAADLISMERR